MTRGSSSAAIAALEALQASWFLNWVVRGSIYDPAMGGSEHHPNAHFFGDVEWYMTCRQIAHAGDTLNSYCQTILASILETDASVWPLVRQKLGGKDPVVEVGKLKLQAKNDKSVRDAIRESLGTLASPEVEIVAALRNKIVHQGGWDPEGKVNETVAQFPPGTFFLYPKDLPVGELPFGQDAAGRLLIDARTGYWATRHVEHHIYMLDQTLCHRFNLPRQRWLRRKSSFTLGVGGNALPHPPGTPLPTSLPPDSPPSTSPPLPDFPLYEHMANPLEVACSATWRCVRNEIDTFVRDYCADAGIRIKRSRIGLAGILLSHTLEGHDHNLSYDLIPTKGGEDHSNQLGIRLRQESLVPFITIWGTHTQMKDFHPCELSEDVRDYLRDCIDQTLTR